jgi:predicted DNA-binding transcriptional regulator AlpA
MKQTPRKQSDEFLSEGELERMGIASRRTLQGWRLLGRGPRYYKLSNGLVRYRWSDIETWLAARAVTPSESASDAPSAVEAVR